MKSGRGMKSLVTAGFLLGCTLACAQSEKTLLEAPVAASVPAESGARGSQRLQNNSEWRAASDVESSKGLTFPAKQFSLSDRRTTADPQDDRRTYSFGAAVGPAPISSFPSTGLEFGDREFAAQGVHIDLTRFFAAMNRPTVEAGSQSEAADSVHYNVKGLLWESLAFTGLENAYRASTDAYMRHLIAHGPYWSNYMASMQHWDMNRWSDGDDFVVDEIGHPMQGGVSAFIEIQNGPRQRLVEFGKSKAYWRSRSLALLWATVFSTQQKIGPLGEAALGSAGGYTYVPYCQFPCSSWRPGKTYLTAWRAAFQIIMCSTTLCAPG